MQAYNVVGFIMVVIGMRGAFDGFPHLGRRFDLSYRFMWLAVAILGLEYIRFASSEFFQ